MKVPDKDQIDAIRAKGAPISDLAELDARGLLMAPGESPEAFLDRLEKLSEEMDGLDAEIAKDGGFELLPGLELSPKERMPQEILSEGEATTEKLYGFKIDWVPGFFLSKGVGHLWGGCAISFPGGYPVVFLIRSAFATKRRWFIYDREELIAHELCHVARTPLSDRPLEEHFAYQTAKSRLRRFSGNCFQTPADAFLFLIPTMILLLAQCLKTFANLDALPIWPFWLLALSGPCWLLLRNIRQRKMAAKAAKALSDAGCAKPDALLFRMDYQEAKELAQAKDAPAAIERLKAKDARLALAFHRFMDAPEKEQETPR